MKILSLNTAQIDQKIMIDISKGGARKDNKETLETLENESVNDDKV